jgi:hypothetical protein
VRGAPWKLALSISGFALVVAPPGALARQTMECDSVLVRLRKEGEQGYQHRSGAGSVDRCEGTFTPEVDDDNLWVAGFFESFADFPTDSVTPLQVTWPSGGSAPTYLTVHSVKLDEPYRMDSQVPAGQSSFAWSTGVVSPLGLQRADLTPMAFSFDQRGALHLPLRIGRGGDGPGSDAYTLTVVPTSRLRDVRVSLARVASVGEIPGPDSYIYFDRSLDQDDLYITREPIHIGIDKPTEPGIYLVEVLGVRDGGTTLPKLAVWFLHPGP